jgi:hypothetical protein
MVIGLVLHDLADPSQIPARLEAYDRIRRNRASAMQVLSNYGMDEDAPAELVEYLEGKSIPSMSQPIFFSPFPVPHFTGDLSTCYGYTETPIDIVERMDADPFA